MCLSLAAVFDIRKRIIPDWIPLVTAGVSLIPPDSVHLWGILAALPLLLAAMAAGGVGGGDIKLTGACGMVRGFMETFQGLFIALCLLVLFHMARQILGNKKDREGKEQAYPLVPFLVIGMFISVRIGG